MTDETNITPEEVNPEPPVARGNPDLPDLRHWGGLRSTKKALRRSATIMANREAIAFVILSMMKTTLVDVASWDEGGANFKVKSSKDLSKDDHRIMMIKGMKSTYHKNGQLATFELLLYDRVALARLAGQAAGLFAKDTEDDKPSVVGMRVVGPKKRRVKTLENGE
jgi:hypothetical protein